MVGVERRFVALVIIVVPALAANAQEAKQHNLLDAKPRTVLTGHKGWVYDLSFSPDGKILASVGLDDGTLRLWDIATGQQLSEFTKQSSLRMVSFHPDGKTIATVSDYEELKDGDRVIRPEQDNTVELWDVASGKSRVIYTTPEIIFGNRYSPDGKMLAISTAGFTGQTILWDVAGGKVSVALLAPVGQTLPFSNDVRFSPDGSVVATTSGGDILMWDAKKGKALSTLKGFECMPSAIAFSPNGRWIAAGGEDGSVKVWNVEDRSLKATLDEAHENVRAVAYSPDNKLLATAGSECVLRLYDAETGKPLASIKAHDKFIPCLAFSPDGKLIATASADCTIKLWEVKALLPK